MISAKEAYKMTVDSVSDEMMEEAMKQVEFTIRQHAADGHRRAVLRRDMFPEVLRAAELVKEELALNGFGVDLMYNVGPVEMKIRW